MADAQNWLTVEDVVTPERVVDADSRCRALLAVAARAVQGRDCTDLAYVPLLARYRGMPATARRSALIRAGAQTAVPTHHIGQIDTEAVGHWITGHYPARRYPAVVLGSPHGAAVHLAARLGAAWLPTGFPVAVHWPGGTVDDPAGALRYGTRVVGRFLRANPGVAVRQLHDPAGRGVLAGSCLDLVVRWRELPAAYRQFLGTRLAPGAPVFLLQDVRTWSVVELGGGHSFQVGSPVSGLTTEDLRNPAGALGDVLHAAGGDPGRWRLPDDAVDGCAEHALDVDLAQSLCRWARQAGVALHRVRHAGPDPLSGAVADVLRRWQADNGVTTNGCLVDCGRLLDPARTASAGLVPYWCESAVRNTVAGAEWWLAGTARFDTVDVVPEPGGVPGGAQAGLPQWRAVASFGRLRGEVDRRAARAYPSQPLATRHASAVLRARASQSVQPGPLTVTAALAGLRHSAAGLLVS